MSVALVVPERYKPREQFSPSGLELLAQCGHKWGLRYIRGIKEAALPNWEEVCHLVRPPKPKPADSYHRTAALREELKEYNRLTRRALGHALHHVSQVYYDWHPPLKEVDWDDRPAVLFMAGLYLLPNAEHCQTLWLEEELTFEVGPRADPLPLFGFGDIVVRFHRRYGGKWKLYDLKSTYSFDYCKTPDELRDDVQACFYALALMIEHELVELECRWVYFLTDETKRPDARGVDFTITREHAEEVLRAHSRRALAGREAMRATAPERRTLSVLQQNVLACDTFGGCLHKDSVFCKPKVASKGELFAAMQGQKDLLRKRREALKGAPEPSRAKPAQLTRARGLPSAHHATEERKRTMAKGNRFTQQLEELDDKDKPDDDATDEGEREEKPARRASTSAADREPPPQRRNAAPKKPAPKLSNFTEADIEITVGGKSFAVPHTSPLHKRILSVAEALFSE